MKKKYILLLLFFSLFLLPRYSANAHYLAPTDFEFWYGAPVWAPGYNSPQKLHLTNVSSTAPANYRIDMQANPGSTPIDGTIAAGGSQIVDLTTLIAAITVAPANKVVNKGLRIQVNGQMGSYYVNEKVDNYGTMPLRDPNALGTFIVSGQNMAPNRSAGSPALAVVTAPQDNTQMTITPSKDITDYGANVPFAITLMKGQSYSANTISKSLNHLGGTLINSTAPVAVTC